jgi:hypothetical protein
MSNLPNLTTKQLAYCTYRAKGENKARSYLLAGYKAANSEQAGSAACKLESDNRVSSYISTLRESSFLKEALTLAEKRAYLARAVRCDVSNADVDLVQEVSETANEHGVSKKVKVVDKLRALELDSKIAGDFYSDREPQVSNPFMFIVSLSKPMTLDESSPVIDAELVTERETLLAN